MLVAVIVGSIRTRADETSNPAAILHTINERMLGRAGGHFATCIAAHLRPDGTMLIANAGHLPPYRNGVALEIPGSIPLGITPNMQCDVDIIALSPTDRIAFFTDGVLEARNDKGELLGFDRLAALSTQPAEAIAHAAIQHGQDDDITILSIRFNAPALAAESSPLLEASPI
jgi:serine phosphatase RsbU (regulator of sigma subunit)